MKPLMDTDLVRLAGSNDQVLAGEIHDQPSRRVATQHLLNQHDNLVSLFFAQQSGDVVKLDLAFRC